MQFIQGKNREQSLLFPESLDQIIEQDNEVRLIDLFAESISLQDFKFIIKTTKEGRPAYHPKDLQNSLCMVISIISDHPGNWKRNANATLSLCG